MKKQLLAFCMTISFATSTMSDAIPWKPLFDIAAVGIATSSLWRNWDRRNPNSRSRQQSRIWQNKGPYRFVAAHLAVYAYALPSLWNAWKEYRANDGTIKVKK